MKTTPLNIYSYKKASYKQDNPVFCGAKKKDEIYSNKQKLIVASTTVLGVLGSCALLARNANYSLNPKKMFTNIKNSYLSKVKFEIKEVCAIGAGSCLGGLAGGYIIDKDKENRRIKRREAMMHYGNIAIPIITVGVIVDEVFKKSNKWIKATAGMCGIVAGLYLANNIMNKVCNSIFKNESAERGIEITDLPAHLDDAVVSAGYVFPNSKFVHGLSRIIPLALMVAGNEVGTKTKEDFIHKKNS